MGTWLDFDDAEVAFGLSHTDVRGHGFVVQLADPSADNRRQRAPDRAGFPAVRGRWLARRGILVTAIMTAVGELPSCDSS